MSVATIRAFSVFGREGEGVTRCRDARNVVAGDTGITRPETRPDGAKEVRVGGRCQGIDPFPSRPTMTALLWGRRIHAALLKPEGSSHAWAAATGVVSRKTLCTLRSSSGGRAGRGPAACQAPRAGAFSRGHMGAASHPRVHRLCCATHRTISAGPAAPRGRLGSVGPRMRGDSEPHGARLARDGIRAPGAKKPASQPTSFRTGRTAPSSSRRR